MTATGYISSNIIFLFCFLLFLFEIFRVAGRPSPFGMMSNMNATKHGEAFPPYGGLLHFSIKGKVENEHKNHLTIDIIYLPRFQQQYSAAENKLQ